MALETVPSRRHSERQYRFYVRLSSAALTRSGVNGAWRTRAPVASKMALAIAPAATVTAVSPAPVARARVG